MKYTEHQLRVFEDRYQSCPKETIEDAFKRVATFASKSESVLGLTQKEQIEMFYSGMVNRHFTPAGRPLANIGPQGNNMLFNCFVLPIEDSRKGIIETLGDFTEIAAAGGGIGIDYSPLRPRGEPTKTSKGTASGPCSFIDVFQSMAVTIKQNGTRGLATMSMLRVDHPDIESFIEAKFEEGRWPTTNISVGITDEFMKAVKTKSNFNLVWNGSIKKVVFAPDLWHKICKYAHGNGEPGLLFIDTMNRISPYRGLEEISCTNPCGEVPLPSNGACNLGSVIVSSFVDLENNTIDLEGIEKAAFSLTILLDNFIDKTSFPTKAIGDFLLNYRPLGVGIMGLADALFLLGCTYGDNEQAITLTKKIVQAVSKGSLLASEQLAKQYGPFPAYQESKVDYGPRRNVTLTSYAPTGSISAFFDVSSGIEPHFCHKIKRTEEIGQSITETGVIAKYMNYHHITNFPSHARFSISGPEGTELSVKDHLAILKIVAENSHSGVSKTINLPESSTIADVSDVFMFCYDNAIKGCTVYRTNSRSLVPIENAEEAEEELEEDAEDDYFEVIDYVQNPKFRPDEVEGCTYKVKFNPTEPPMYVVINDVEEEPLEIFFKVNNAHHQEYLDGLSRAITSLWRRGIRADHLFEEFCEYESPNAGSFYEYKRGKRKYLKSILDAIGTVVQKHFRKLDFEDERVVASQDCIATSISEVKDNSKGQKCPSCKEYTLQRIEGCLTCTECGYSKCG